MTHALLVEDDVFSAAILQEILMGCGHSVRLVYDGPSALQLLDDGQKFDLAVVDLVLPNQIGLDVIRALRGSSKDMAIIGIGGEEDTAARNGVTSDAAARAGANVTVAKPISRPELSRQIKSMLS